MVSYGGAGSVLQIPTNLGFLKYNLALLLSKTNVAYFS